MKKEMRYLSLLSLSVILFLSGCGFKHLKTSTQSQLMRESIAPDEGYILIGMFSDSFVQGLHLVGVTSIVADFKKGNKFDFNRQYWIAKVKAGQYTFDRIDFNGNFYTKTDDEEKWTVEVKPQTISYVGDLEIKLILENDLFFQTDLMNRSSYAFEHMKQNYPELTSRYEFDFTGVGKDDFSKLLVNK